MSSNDESEPLLSNPEKILPQSAEKKSIGREIYEKSAEFGLFYSLISAWIGTFIGIIFVGVSIYCLVHKTLRTSTLSATVMNNTSCDTNNICTNTQVKYKINGNETIYTFNDPSKKYVINDIVIFLDCGIQDLLEYILDVDRDKVSPI
jgi:hypothetical protein